MGTFILTMPVKTVLVLAWLYFCCISSISGCCCTCATGCCGCNLFGCNCDTHNGGWCHGEDTLVDGNIGKYICPEQRVEWCPARKLRNKAEGEHVEWLLPSLVYRGLYKELLGIPAMKVFYT